MDLDVAFCDCASLWRPGIDGDCELVHTVARLAVVLDGHREGAGRVVLSTATGEGGAVARNAQGRDRDAVHVHITGMVLVLELAAHRPARRVPLRIEAEV